MRNVKKQRPMTRILGAISVAAIVLGGIIGGIVDMPRPSHAWVDDQWLTPASAASNITSCEFFSSPPAALTTTGPIGVACDANRFVMVDIGAGSVSATLNAGSAYIGQVGVAPQIAVTDTIVQLDFSSGGGSSGCQPATVYDGHTAPAITSLSLCYIVKSGPGVLLQPTWDSLSSMVSLASAGAAVVCRDGTDGTGNVVWQASAFPGQTANYKPFGRPFKRGLACTANMAIPGGSATNVLDMEVD